MKKSNGNTSVYLIKMPQPLSTNREPSLSDGEYCTFPRSPNIKTPLRRQTQRKQIDFGLTAWV